jgi:hypothetical protein
MPCLSPPEEDRSSWLLLKRPLRSRPRFVL